MYEQSLSNIGHVFIVLCQGMNLWQNSMCERDLIHAVGTIEQYNPLVEDISLDDENAVKEIEYKLGLKNYST